jgi:hypothetical protein
MDLVLTVLMDVARGMQYIHNKNIIHGGEPAMKQGIGRIRGWRA